MPLPSEWIDRLFSIMGAMYGSRFADMWAGVDVSVMKQVWADKLSGFSENPEVIGQALDSMEGAWPPTLPEFVELCRQKAKSSGNQYLSLPHYEPINREKAAEALEKINKLMGRRA